MKEKEILELWRKHLSGLAPIKSLGPDSTYPRPEKNSMSESKHMSGQWFHSCANGGTEGCCIWSENAPSATNEVIADFSDMDGNDLPDSCAHNDFICRACNAHDDLLAAIEDICYRVEAHCFARPTGTVAIEKAAKRCRELCATIAKAEKK